MRGQEQRPPPGHRMRAHEPLAHRLEGGNFLRRQIGEADRVTRINQRMLANQGLDLGLAAIVQCVVGGTHICEFRIRTPGGKHPPGEQGIFCGYRAEGAVGVPQPVTELKEPHSILVRHDVAVLVEVGKIGDARAQPLFLAFSDMTRRLIAFELAEMAGKRDLLFISDVLVAKDQHGIPVHPGLDRSHLLPGERFAAIDALDFADKYRMHLADRYGHSVSPLVLGLCALPTRNILTSGEMVNRCSGTRADRFDRAACRCAAAAWILPC